MISHKKISFLLAFSFLYLQSNVANESGEKLPKGHLQPLGSHREPDTIEERYDIPSPLEFWSNYVKISKPVVFRGAAKHSKAYRLWNDKYLKEMYGDLEVRLEGKGEKSGRVPIGAKGLGRDTIGRFIYCCYLRTLAEVYKACMFYMITSFRVCNAILLANYTMVSAICFVPCGSFYS